MFIVQKRLWKMPSAFLGPAYATKASLEQTESVMAADDNSHRNEQLSISTCL